MRWLLTSLLLSAAFPIQAAEDEAEKLFRAMEQKVKAAKTLRVRYELDISAAADKKGTVKGAILLGEGDQYRLDGEGKIFGQQVKFTTVCDGARVSEVVEPPPPQSETNPPRQPKGSGAFLRAALPPLGFFLTSLFMDRRDTWEPPTVSDFKLVGNEKVGGRAAKVIQFTVTAKGGDGTAFKLWLDAETNLPAKLAMTGGESDIKAVTETYAEFAVDVKVEAKSFAVAK